MKLGSTLNTTFATAKPATSQPLDSLPAPVSVVYNNGVALAPATPPVVANIAVGLYTLVYGLTAPNGHADYDWVTIVERTTLDGFLVARPAWEGNLIQDGAESTLLLGKTIYPLFTTHWPATGANADPDRGVPTIDVYRNLVLTGIVPVLLHPAVGIFIITLPITAGGGWAAGDRVDILATTVMDTIPASSWVFSGGQVVASVGGGGGSTGGLHVQTKTVAFG